MMERRLFLMVVVSHAALLGYWLNDQPILRLAGPAAIQAVITYIYVKGESEA